MAEKRDQKPQRSEIPKLEWIVGAIGAVVTVAVVGFLLYEGISGDHSPPDITVEIKEIVPVRSGYRVLFEARNEGGEAAAQVAIEGTLGGGNAEPEVSEVVIGYLPAHSERGGGLFFTKDPRGAPFQVRSRGYEDP